ncbi:hypothetical protein Tco_1426483, partial [Tanacetum coccineum]
MPDDGSGEWKGCGGDGFSEGHIGLAKYLTLLVQNTLWAKDMDLRSLSGMNVVPFDVTDVLFI